MYIYIIYIYIFIYICLTRIFFSTPNHCLPRHMLWTHPKMTFNDLSPSIHTFVVPSLWMWTGTLWLASNLRNVAEVAWYHSPGYKNPSYKTPSQQPEAGASPCGLDVARWPLGWETTSCQQEARAFSDETTRKETSFCQKPGFGSRLFLCRDSIWEHCPVYTLITAAGEPSRRPSQTVLELLPQETARQYMCVVLNLLGVWLFVMEQ